MAELIFQVTRDEDGNFCACAETADGTLCTNGRTLDELVAMIHDVLCLYCEDCDAKVDSFSLRFTCPSNVAA